MWLLASGSIEIGGFPQSLGIYQVEDLSDKVRQIKSESETGSTSTVISSAIINIREDSGTILVYPNFTTDTIDGSPTGKYTVSHVPCTVYPNAAKIQINSGNYIKRRNIRFDTDTPWR